MCNVPLRRSSAKPYQPPTLLSSGAPCGEKALNLADEEAMGAIGKKLSHALEMPVRSHRALEGEIVRMVELGIGTQARRATLDETTTRPYREFESHLVRQPVDPFARKFAVRQKLAK